MYSNVTVIGAGLAGCEAAYQLARRGVKVKLIEQKPKAMTPAHQEPGFAELVCSNSLRADALSNAAGLLKQEMRELSSLIMEAADACRIPAGGALAVDRKAFSDYITQKILSHQNIDVECEKAQALPKEGAVIAAPGPLLSGALAENIKDTVGRKLLSFFDAAAPIVTGESVDTKTAYFASRYGKGGDDYLNCPMDEAQYRAFYEALVSAETAQLHGFEADKVFEGCMPIETMARRGFQTLLGRLSPSGCVRRTAQSRTPLYS